MQATACIPMTLKLAGDAANGVHVVCYFHESDPSEAAQEFVRNLSKIQQKSIHGHHMLMIMYVMHAINRAGTTDGSAVRDAIVTTEGLQGATGVTNFKGAREPVEKT